jgi:hypothetical protein
MEGKEMWRSKILGLSILICNLTAASAEEQYSRSASAASYLDRGNASYAKGKLDQAVADYSLAIQFSPIRPKPTSIAAVPGKTRETSKKR